MKIDFDISRSVEGPVNGLSMGYLILSGNQNIFDTRNQPNDQSVMIYVTISDLLDSFRLFFRSGKRSEWKVVGTDSSVELVFKSDGRKSMTAACCKVLIDIQSPQQMASELLQSINTFYDNPTHKLRSSDLVYNDLTTSLDDFEKWYNSVFDSGQ